MNVSRRKLLTLAGALFAAQIAARRSCSAQDGASSADAGASGTGEGSGGEPRSQRILVLGGTGFLGPHVVDAARARGHVLTLFNRGRTNPHLFPDVEKLHGDRDGGLAELAAAVEGGRTWDAVIDTSGYVPRIVTNSAKLLAPAVQQYVFISTISVFTDTSKVGMDESAPVGTIADETTEEITGESYGPLKALCEKAAEACCPGRATNIRPGLIVGPGDPTDRYSYWPVRLARGGEVLCPGDGSDPVQYVDARDLAAFIVTTIEQRRMGLYNATGPAETLATRAMLDAVREGVASSGAEADAAAARDASFTWVDTSFLEESEVSAWSDMPVWVPAVEGVAGLSTIDCRKAIGHGLAFRPASETARDTIAWFRTLPAERQAVMRGGLSAEREAEVLAKWKERQAG